MTQFSAIIDHAGYGARPVLHDVAFAASAGEITVIAGPNGSGKSTLVKALSGEIAFKGSVEINARSIGALKAWQLAAIRGVLPQETTIAFPFSVEEVVRLGLSAGDFGGVENPARLVEAALEKVGLAGFSRRLVQHLSGGERQRVQLARVLCQIWEPVGESGPRWLIMDEPVASLDIHHQLSLMDLARDFAARGGGVIAVMHDLNLSAMFADRIYLMKGGTVAATGNPQAALTSATLANVFDCPLEPNSVPASGTFILPQSVKSGRAATARLSRNVEQEIAF
jgi:iron complex transport system ATP-binding protein